MSINEREIYNKMNKRAVICVDMSALINNLEVIRKTVGNNKRIMAVVKANAYGCGAGEISRILSEHGVSDFAVATAEEALYLRRFGIKGNILVLGCVINDELAALSQNDITVSISGLEQARQAERQAESQNINIKAHIKIDTGMHRFGIDAHDFEAMREILSMKHIKTEGIYTHLGASDIEGGAERDYTLQQLSRFAQSVEAIRDIAGNLGTGNISVHALSSAGIMNYRDYTYDMVRIGIAFFGAGNMSMYLKPVVTLKARTALIRNVSKGEYIGYGMNYKALSDIRAAVITAGYADGVPRSLSGKGYVLICGKKAPIIGNICMDSLTVDVSGIPEAEEGTAAVIIGKSGSEYISADELARLSGTIPNELLSRLGSRLERVFI